jgi:glycosyltransferase involved in cell wall biosynthesis
MPAKLAGVHSIVSTRHSLVAPPHRALEEIKYGAAGAFCDWIVGICEATTNNVMNLRSVPSRKVVCIYNGSQPLSAVAKDQWPTKNGFTLLYVGRLEPVKNHSLLLKAFCLAITKMPELRLWMVGDGSEREALERLAGELGIAEEVTFWGQQIDVSPFFSAADSFIMSSKSEGLPISLLQAFSLGLPVIVTDVGGMAEVVRLAQAGLTVSAKDPAEMTAAILRMACNVTERQQFAMNAYAAYQSHFTLETMVEAYLNLYRGS